MLTPDSGDFRSGKPRPQTPLAAFIILGALLVAYGVLARSSTFGVLVLIVGGCLLLYGIIAAAVRSGSRGPEKP